ncbi:hypothetical protein DFP72DRAFT_1167742 [Ephemerocybe angulata]|uniref:Uncharacterized protein n=1 Tax=Ephemerocybe angulata TaxID=980116 RepID=A0A8H6I2T0_9AGAR|nr:hypothetical protein DFP72DRAFT_1167742 [Tulosesus angulatus]
MSSTKIEEISVPFPKNTIALVFGECTAVWAQRVHVQRLTSSEVVLNPQYTFGPSDKGELTVTSVDSANDDGTVTSQNISSVAPDPHVLKLGPYTVDQTIRVQCEHHNPDDSEGTWTTNHHCSETHDFQAVGKTSGGGTILGKALTVTMINTEDGGDEDNHDTVVSVAITYTTK